MGSGLTTIGYEGAAQPGIIRALKLAGVDLVIDVRAVAASRRAGFSKTILAASLAAEGLGYLHLRDLGTPKRGRQAARAGRIAEMRAIFDEHMTGAAAKAALQIAAGEAEGVRVCLLCYEADWRGCHRAVLAEMLSARTGLRAEHLRPIPNGLLASDP